MAIKEISEIENELLQAASVKPVKANEDRQKYLTRVMTAVANLKDPEWEGLSKEAQDWTNGAAETHKANKTAGFKIDDKGYEALDDFPDYVMVQPDEPEEEAPPPKKEKAVKQYAPRKVSACHSIKTMVVQNPTITVPELSEKLKEAGLKVSDVTIATLRSDLRDTLRVMNELSMGKVVFTL